jgi:hypothetical protein
VVRDEDDVDDRGKVARGEGVVEVAGECVDVYKSFLGKG